MAGDAGFIHCDVKGLLISRHKIPKRGARLGVAWRDFEEINRNPGSDRPAMSRLGVHFRKEIHFMKRSLVLS